jgi:tetratricopeptide (TPR) repeat protein
MSDFTPHEAPIREIQRLPVPPPTKLVGRDPILTQVYGHLKENQQVLIHGPQGVGKTAIAATLASAYAQQPGGVLWLRVDNLGLEELLVRVGRAYSISEVSSSENPISMIGAVENALRANKPLVVLDGQIGADAASRFISRCVNDLPLVIVNDEEIEGPWESVAVDKLDESSAAALFKQEARLTTDEHDIDIYGVVKLLDYMPFGIVVTARSMIVNKQTPGEIHTALKAVTQAAGGNNPVAGLTVSFSKLNGALQGLLLMMGATFEGRISGQLLSMVSGAPMDSIQQAANILSQLYMVERSQRYGYPYYSLHPLTLNFAQAGLRRSNKLEDLQKKVRDSLLDYLRLYGENTTEHDNRVAAEMDTVMATARWASQNGENELVSELVNILTQHGDFVKTRGYLYDLLRLRGMTGSGSAFPAYPPEEIEVPDFLSGFDTDEEEHIDIPDFLEQMADEADEDFDEEYIEDYDEDEDGEDEDDEAVDMPAFLSTIGTAEATLDQLSSRDLTQLRAMLAQARQSGQASEQLKILKAIGEAQLDQNMQNEAIATYSEILTLYDANEDAGGQLETLQQLADLMVQTENSQAAVMNATRGVKLAQQLNDSAAQLKLLSILGDSHQQLGESSLAVSNYEQALALAGGNLAQEAVLRYKLGFAQLDDGEAETAISTWEGALEMFKSQGKRSYEGRTLGGLGSAYGDLGRWTEAVSYHTSALHIARDVGDHDEESLQLNSLAYAAYQANQLGEAVLRYRQALHLAYESQDRDNIVSTIVDLSRLLLQSRMYLDIVEMLVDDALTYEPHDRDLAQLKDRIATERPLAEAYGTQLKPITGTARDYAANAYALLQS